MVGAWHPAGIFPVHTRLPYQNVIEGVIQHMTHVQDAGDVGRGNNYGVGFTFIRLGMEEFMLQPIGIPLILHLGGIVLCRQFHFYFFMCGQNPAEGLAQKRANIANFRYICAV